jgi:hypothetical protein
MGLFDKVAVKGRYRAAILRVFCGFRALLARFWLWVRVCVICGQTQHLVLVEKKTGADYVAEIAPFLFNSESLNSIIFK